MSYPVVIGLEEPLDEPLLECPLVTVMDLGRLAPADGKWESEMPLGRLTKPTLPYLDLA